MRLWVLLSDFKNDISFSDDSIKNAGKQYFKIRNYLRFLINNLYRDKHFYDEVDNLIKQNISELKNEINKSISEIDYSKAVRGIITFLIKYSSTLTEDIKNKLYESDINSDFRTKTENEFSYVAKNLSEIIYPFLPFLSIELNREISTL